MTYKHHLRNNWFISLFVYLVCCVAQRTIVLSEFSDGAALALACLLFLCNAVYYAFRYLEGDFSYNKPNYYDKYYRGM